MFVIALTDPINDRDQRGGLARAGGTNDQSESLFLSHLLADGLHHRGGKSDFVEWSNSVRDQPNGHANPLMREMSLNAKPPDAQGAIRFFAFRGEIDLPFGDQFLP